MSEQCILVTGGAGFVGSHSVIELINAGYYVVVLDNFVNASHGRLLEELWIECTNEPVVSTDIYYNIHKYIQNICISFFFLLRMIFNQQLIIVSSENLKTVEISVYVAIIINTRFTFEPISLF